jgi:predicted MPP superfamily phosphohydrolase
MKLCWLADIHLNFLSKKDRLDFYKKIEQKDSDAVVISGDIAEATSLCLLLQEMAQVLHKKIYFVLGNHDYYYGEIKAIRNNIRKLCNKESLLHWLPMSKPAHINSNILLLGQDGWADGRYGSYIDSKVVLNDSKLIRDLFEQAILGKDYLLAKMQKLADFDAQALQNDLTKNLSGEINKIIILTHVPPFKESCIYKGEVSSSEWLPFFALKVSGEVILAAAHDNPAIDFLVLCGHTHSSGVYQALPNLLIKTGEAKYYYPEVQEIIII